MKLQGASRLVRGQKIAVVIVPEIVKEIELAYVEMAPGGVNKGPVRVRGVTTLTRSCELQLVRSQAGQVTFTPAARKTGIDIERRFRSYEGQRIGRAHV